MTFFVNDLCFIAMHPERTLLFLHCFQDDIMMGTLTVRENFHFSASLRLPSHMTYKQRKERVEKVIDELGLTKCADTKV